MRLGINVPNELLERVKAIRPEVNVSQICRDALAEHVRQTERVRAQVSADGMREHALRFASEDKAPMIEPDWAGMAQEDVRDWIYWIDAEEWEEFWDYWYDSINPNDNRDLTWLVGGRGANPNGKRLVDRMRENEDWIMRHEANSISDTCNKAESEYVSAWITYAIEVRQMHEKHRWDKLRKLTSEKETTTPFRQEPELPPHLLD